MKYSERVLEELKKNNPYQPEFIQAATEVLESLSPVVDTDLQVFLSAALRAVLTLTLRARAIWKLCVSAKLL